MTIKVELGTTLLARNDELAAEIRYVCADNGIFLINIMSSPGAGKTTLLEKTLELLAGKLRAAVIEGDVSTTLDAERLARFGIQVVQINTEPFGGSCHLNARMIAGSLSTLDFKDLDLLFIENVGNLICPAEFDLGEHEKVIVASVAEGEEKPLKYPLMFRRADLVIINKMDLCDRLQTDMRILISNIRKVNPSVQIIELSALTGEGCSLWIDRLQGNFSAFQEPEGR